jgi:hypothetical protein
VKEVFPIVPASSGVIWFLLIVALVLFVVAALMALLALSCRHASLDVSPEEVRIHGWPYGRTIALTSLVLDDARVINLETDQEFRPSWRTNGIGLPGYSTGWFKLRNGQKALAFITDRTRIAYFSTTEGYVVLLSVENPDALVATLKRVALAGH